MNRIRYGKKMSLLVLIAVSALLTACGQQKGQDKGKTVLVLAVFGENPEISKQAAEREPVRERPRSDRLWKSVCGQ